MLRARRFAAPLAPLTFCVLVAAAPALAGCASLGPPPEVAPALAPGSASTYADDAVRAFYASPTDSGPALTVAVTVAPRHGALREAAGYQAILAGDSHAAFVHFLYAAADPDAVAPELYLSELKSLAHTASEHATAAALYRELSEKHPRADIRDLAAAALAWEQAMLAHYGASESTVDRLGFIDAWSVVGAFENDQNKGFSVAYPPESATGGDGPYDGMRAKVQWRTANAAKVDGFVALGDVIAPNESTVAYAKTFIVSPLARAAELRISSTNGVRAWLGGQLIVSDDKLASPVMDGVAVPINLQAGTTELLVKSAHRSGPWTLAARITDPGGGRIADLRFSATGTSTPPVMTNVPPPKALQPVAVLRLYDANRRRFLLARFAARAGKKHAAAEQLQALLADVPQNPLALASTALALWDIGEVGKTLDLLSRGVDQHPTLAIFLAKRGRYYANRKLWDKAEHDLRAALALSPKDDEAAKELAAIYGSRGLTIDRCRELGAALAKWPDDAGLLTELGQCRDELGYPLDAERRYEQAHALLPGNVATTMKLFRLAERRADYGAALGWIKDVRAGWPSTLGFALDQADVARRSGHPREAEQLLAAARDQSPDAWQPYERLGALAHEQGRLDEAARLYTSALERDPDNAALVERITALVPSATPLEDRLAPTADEIDKAVRDGAHVAVHAGSSSIVLLDDEVTHVNADGSVRRIVTLVRRAVNTEGRDALLQMPLPMSPKLKVLDAYAIAKDGAREEASSIGAGSIRFRGLDVGSTTVVRYSVISPASRFLPNEFSTQWRFQQIGAQVERSRWRVILGKGRDLHVTKRGEITATDAMVDGQHVYTFLAEHIAPVVAEPMMPPPVDVLWTATVSTVGSWDDFARWERALLVDAFPASPELDALSAKLTQGAKTKREKLDRLWAHVADQIRYQQEYEDAIAGVKPHAAPVIVERGYGDCKDKAVLLIRLAKAAGIELRFALLNTTPHGKVLREIPNQQFNHAIVYVPAQDGIAAPLFVDATTNALDLGNLRVDDQGALSFVLDPQKGTHEFIAIPYAEPDTELSKQVITVDLAKPEAAHAKDRLTLRGAEAESARLVLRTEDRARKLYESAAAWAFPGSSLTAGEAKQAQDLTRPLDIDLDIDLHGAVQKEAGGYRLNLPYAFPLERAATLATRKLPLELRRTTSSLELVAELPEGNEATHTPSDLHVEDPCFTFDRATKTAGRKVTITTSFKETCTEVAPKDYPRFREAVQRAVVAEHDNLVFEAVDPKAKKNKKKAPLPVR